MNQCVKQSGFSLPEALIAALLFSVSLLGLIQYHQALSDSFQRQWQIRQAWTLAQQRLDEYASEGSNQSQLILPVWKGARAWQLSLSDSAADSGCRAVTALVETPDKYKASLTRWMC